MSDFTVLVVSRCSYRFPANQGGSDIASFRSARALAQLHNHVLLVGQGALSEAVPDLEFIPVSVAREIGSRFRLTYYLKGFCLSTISSIKAAKTLLIRPEIQIIHSNSNLATIVLKRLFPHRPVVYTIHDPLLSGGEQNPFIERFARIANNWVLERLALRWADHVIVVSEALAAQVAAVGIEDSRVTLIRPLPDPLAESRVEGPSLANPIFRPPFRDYVVTVGAQTGRKRFDLLIRGLACTKRRFGMVLVGNGHDHSSLEELAATEGLADRTIFIERVDGPSLNELYTRAFVCAIASDREGFPASILEAAAFGTPGVFFTADRGPARLESGEEPLRIVHSQAPSTIGEVLDHYWEAKTSGELSSEKVKAWASANLPTSEDVGLTLTDIFSKLLGTLKPASLEDASRRERPSSLLMRGQQSKEVSPTLPQP